MIAARRLRSVIVDPSPSSVSLFAGLYGPGMATGKPGSTAGPRSAMARDGARSPCARPLLNPLFRPVTSLDGIGEKLALALRRVLGGGEADPMPRVGRPPVPPAGGHHRPQPPARDRPRPGGRHRHAPGPRRPPPEAAAAATAASPTRSSPTTTSGEIALTFFHANEQLARQDLPGRRHPLCQRQDGVVRRPAVDGPPRPRRQRGRPRLPAADRAGLPADRRPHRQDAGPRHPRGDRQPARRCRSGSTRRWSPAKNWPAFAEALARRPPSRRRRADFEPTSPAPRPPRL